MPDFERERSMVEGHVLPAGSIVLTGTPDGVALKPPTTIAQKVSLVLRGLLRGRKPSAQFVAEQTRDRASLGYLKPGDRFDQWIQHLGRQRWAVGEPAADTVCRG
jgi:2-keto-4-pentenoate hydratase/2-oxohepta-3-ene-1,7-dioic acid hydratase in catechol pathway